MFKPFYHIHCPANLIRRENSRESSYRAGYFTAPVWCGSCFLFAIIDRWPKKAGDTDRIQVRIGLAVNDRISAFPDAERHESPHVESPEKDDHKE
jgi:hypothetical protein